MKQIPVTFPLAGKTYTGTLDEVHGSGGHTWHLMVGGYYWGRLRLAGDRWYFDEGRKGVGELVDHFAGMVIAAYG